MSQPENIEQLPVESQSGRPRHVRRPPLAEIDTWELWQAWRRGERNVTRPWLGLMFGFCVLLATMYAFFFYTTSINRDTVAQVALLIVLVGFLVAVWRRISERRLFAFYATAGILLVSGAVFAAWFLFFVLSGYSAWYATLATPVLGLIGLVIGLRSLNALAPDQGPTQ